MEHWKTFPWILLREILFRPRWSEKLLEKDTRWTGPWRMSWIWTGANYRETFKAQIKYSLWRTMIRLVWLERMPSVLRGWRRWQTVDFEPDIESWYLSLGTIDVNLMTWWSANTVAVPNTVGERKWERYKSGISNPKVVSINLPWKDRDECSNKEPSIEPSLKDRDECSQLLQIDHWMWIWVRWDKDN